MALTKITKAVTDDNVADISKTVLKSQLCQAWVNFNGTGTVAIRDSFNVSSITDSATGQYELNFIIPMSNVNYSITGVVKAATNETMFVSRQDITATVNAVRIGAVTGAGAFTDASYVNAQVFSN